MPIHYEKNAGIKVETCNKSQRLCSTVVFFRKKERVYAVLQRQSLRLFQRFCRRVSAAFQDPGKRFLIQLGIYFLLYYGHILDTKGCQLIRHGSITDKPVIDYDYDYKIEFE